MKLQDAIDRFTLALPLLDEPGDAAAQYRDDAQTLVEAARRVANGVHIRYCVQHEGRMPYGANRCQGYFATVGEDSSCDTSDYLLIAALSITEDE